MGAEDELVTIVDERNRVVGAVPRRQMRAGKLPHRATYVLVFNSRGDLYVQKRTQSKDVFAGYYDVAAGGSSSPGKVTKRARSGSSRKNSGSGASRSYGSSISPTRTRW